MSFSAVLVTGSIAAVAAQGKGQLSENSIDI
jgi:hypothetical protein